MRSQWGLAEERCGFLENHQDKFNHMQQAALYDYLMDPSRWGLGWSALERAEREAAQITVTPIDGKPCDPYEDMSMWHVVQYVAKPVCQPQG